MVQLPTPIQELSDPLFKEKSLRIFVKREDLLHAEIMGNKWRKLKYNLIEAKKQGFSTILTFGGAYSNHIAATAAACKESGFKSIGIIRGDELNENSNPTLQFATKKGMELHFKDRNEYRRLRDDPYQIKEEFPKSYILPEGGTNSLAIKGCSEILIEDKELYDIIVCPIGTGGTVTGIIKSASKNQIVLGISSLKGDFIKEEINGMINFPIFGNYEVNTQYHFGGYAKTTSELIEFMNLFKEKHGIQLEPIYTGKTFFAVWDMIKHDKFDKNQRIMLIHTGGLQGIEGFNRKNGNIIQ
ncbi:MAG: 1-aminocyclopropane-1-carboxylate deaminase/D-cysteine desulfhydrase [Ekhidna sp.]